MTQFSYKVKGNEFTLDVKGHAGYAEYGNDIICSAISILVQTLDYHIREVAEQYKVHKESGNVHIWAKGREAIAAADTIYTGLDMLSADYPDYIQRVS